MVHILAALMVAAVLLWLPGIAFVSAAARHLPTLETLALAPPVSIAAYFLVGVTLDGFGRRVEFATVARPVLVISALWVVVAMVRGLVDTRHGSRPSRQRPHWTHVAVAAVVVLALIMWVISIGSPETVPAFDDGANHGIFVRRILDFGTLDPRVVVSTDLASPTGGVAYYPLALHLIASFVSSVCGTESALSLHVVVVAVTAIGAPIAMFAFIRRLLDIVPVPGVDGRVASAVGALIAVITPAALWANLIFGGLPLVSGIALLPAFLLAFLLVVTRDWRCALILGIVTYGSFVWHNAEVVTGALLALGFLVGWVRVDPTRLRPLAFRLGISVSAAAVLLVPLLSALRAGFEERVGGDSGEPLGAGSAVINTALTMTSSARIAGNLDPLALLSAAAALTAIVVGVRLCLRDPVLRCLLVPAACLVVVAWGCSAGIWILQRLGTPWYANGDRILGSLLPVYALLWGLALSYLMSRRTAWRWIVVAATGSYALIMVSASLAFGDSAYRDHSVVTAADRVMFTWLGAHGAPGQRVLNDSHDGSMWMYDLGGATPVFGPRSDFWGVDSFAGRRYLLANIGSVDTDPRVRTLASALGVRYVAVGERLIRDQGRQFDVEAIGGSSGLREVFHVGDARVYEIQPPRG